MFIRWDSNLACMEGVLYHEECLVRLDRRGLLVVTTDGIKKKLIPSFTNFSMIKAGCKILKHCQITTKVFEQEKVPTIPLIVDRLFTMDKELEELAEATEQSDPKAAEFVEVLREELESRFPAFGTTNLPNAMGNYLNPAVKGCHLELLNKLEEVKEKMEELLCEWKPEQEEMENQQLEREKSEPRKLTATERLKKQMQERKEKATKGPRPKKSAVFSTKSSHLSRRFQNECSTYEKVLPYAPSDVDQLMWWKIHQEALPLLAFMVRVIFPIPVASSKSERVFSVAGNVVTQKRACLAPEKVESCVIVKTNLSLLRDMGFRK